MPIFIETVKCFLTNVNHIAFMFHITLGKKVETQFEDVRKTY